MESDQYTPPIWVVNSPSLHEFLYIELPLDKATMEVIASVDKTMKYVYR